MAVLDSSTLEPDFIKLRWLEPYVSAGMNRKTFKSLPRGVYSGFVVEPGPGSLEVQIRHNNPEGFGEVSGFADGSFDPASSGWSVAVHASLQGYTSTVAILHKTDGSNDFSFDLTSYAGTTVFVALHVDYNVGFGTAGDVRVVEAVDLDADPTLINLARVDVPGVGSISDANIVLNDSAYPRVLPFANEFKYGFMSKFQATLLEEIANISGSPAFNSTYIVPTDGPQTIPLATGDIYVVGSDDLWVFKNGSKKIKGRDYTEVDRGDGHGEEISYIGLELRAGDIIEFRTQEFSSVLTSKTHTLDEAALISDNTIFFNFSGTGVTVLPDGTNRVKVVIPGGGAASLVRTKTNTSGLGIGIYKAVTINSDNTIKAFDPTVSGDSLYGVSLQTIPDSAAGDIQIGGIIMGAGMGVSGSIGDDVYVDDDGLGTLDTTPPDPSSSQVIRVGILDGIDTAVSGTPVDVLFDRGRLS